MKKLFAILVFAGLMTGAFAQKHTEIEMIRSVYKLEKKAVVADFMKLSNDDAAKFWPIYEKYEAERIALGDRKVKIITDYVNDRQKEVKNADSMVKESADIQRSEVSLREKYYKEVKDAISLKTALDFYQVEDVIATAVRMKIWEEMPMH